MPVKARGSGNYGTPCIYMLHILCVHYLQLYHTNECQAYARSTGAPTNCHKSGHQIHATKAVIIITVITMHTTLRSTWNCREQFTFQLICIFTSNKINTACLTGWLQSRRKNSRVFQAFSEPHTYLSIGYRKKK